MSCPVAERSGARLCLGEGCAAKTARRTVLGMHRSGTSATWRDRSRSTAWSWGRCPSEPASTLAATARSGSSTSCTTRSSSATAARGGSLRRQAAPASAATSGGATRSSARSRAGRSGSRIPGCCSLLELWRDLDPKPIGVIRNPVAVRKSLERRARERAERHPQLSAASWEQLWTTYNRALLRGAGARAVPGDRLRPPRRARRPGPRGARLPRARGRGRVELLRPGAGRPRCRRMALRRSISGEALELWDELARRSPAYG